MQDIPDGAKKVIEIYQKLESQKCRADLLFFGEAILRAQEVFKADYGIPEQHPETGAGKTA
jgi:hypothetical protein